MRILIILAIITYALTFNANANTNPSLIADIITVSEDGNVINAKGNVNISFENQSLKASMISYNKLTGKINALGPIILDDGKQTIILADEAILDKNFNNAVLKRVRFVLSRSLEISSAKVIRENSRFNNFYETIASTCMVCKKNKTPLWEIRSRKIVHDSKLKEVYFYNAQFRLSGIPIMYFPTLRIPDPSVKRANGFLIPEINHSSVSGTELNLPYFVALNKSSDIIFKPKVSTSKNVSLGVEYRKLFKKSDLGVDMFVTNDRNSSNKSKGYLFGNYDSKYENNIELSLQYQKTTDLDLLSQHTTKDLKFTETYVKLKKQDTSLYINSGFYQSKLQKSSVSDLNMANLRHETISDYIFYPKKLGGQANLLINLSGYKRQSTENGNLGRDAFKIKSDLSWRKDIITKKGYIIGLKSLSSAKVSKYYNDTNYQATLSKINQTNGIELSFPLVNRQNYSSTIYVPKLQLIYSAPHMFNEPNEDSFYSEISLSNFSDLNRTYGMDRSENGLRLQTSIKTSHRNSKGFESEIFMGSINRLNGSHQFSSESGTTENKSNLFGSLKLNFFNEIKISGNVFSNAQFNLTKRDFQVNYMKNNINVYSKYFQKDKDDLYGFAENRSELAIGTKYQFNRKTNSNFSLIYDLKNKETVKSQFNSRYQHDCMAIDFYLSRGFYSVSSVKPGISLGVKVELTGLTKNNKVETSQRCNGS